MKVREQPTALSDKLSGRLDFLGCISQSLREWIPKVLDQGEELGFDWATFTDMGALA